MNKDNKIYKNYIYNVSYQVIQILTPLIIAPYIARVLGVSNVGIFSFTTNIVSYFILFGSIGIVLYGQREIAFHQENLKKRSTLFWELFFLRCITLSISLFIYCCTIVNYGEYKFVYLLWIIQFIGSMLDISWFFQGLEEFKKIVIRNFVIKFISIFLIFFLINEKQDLYKYILVISGSLLLGNLCIWVYLPKYITKVNFRDLSIFKHVKPTLILFVPQIAVSIYTLLDSTMLGIICNTNEVAYYVQAQKIIKVALTLVTSLGIVMLPRVSNTFASRDKRKIQYYINGSFRFVFFLGCPIMFGLMGIAKGLIPWFLGNEFLKTIPIMMIMSPIVLIIGLSNVIGKQYFIPTMEHQKYNISVIAGAVSNFILNLILIPFLKSYGAAVATIGAELIVTIVQFYFVRDIFSIRRIFLLSKKYMFASGVMFFTLIILVHNFRISIISTLIEIFLSAFIYFVILLLLKDEYIYRIIKKKY